VSHKKAQKEGFSRKDAKAQSLRFLCFFAFLCAFASLREKVFLWLAIIYEY